MAKKKKRELTRITEYLITGGAWFWSGYAMFALLYGVFHVGLIPAKVIAYIFGLSVNFLLERFWVFAEKNARKQITKVTGRYILLSVVNLGIDTAIVWSLNRVGITPFIGQFVSAAFFTVWNYLWYKLWVFARGKKPGPKRLSSPQLHRPKHVRHVRS